MKLAFSFTDTDLAANHLGKLSPSQRQRVGDVHQRQRGQLALLWAMMLALAVASLLAAQHIWDLALWWGLEGAFLVWLTRRSLPVFRPSRYDADLAAVEGTATLKLTGKDHYTLLIGNLRFTLTLQQYKALTSQQRYRVYYVVPLQIIVAVEPIAPPP